MTGRSKKIHPWAASRMAQFLDRQIDSLSGVVTQSEIANALGYPSANIISMFKKGQTKVPLEKIPDLAKVLRVDPAFLMRLGLDQYWPERWEALRLMFDGIATNNERELLDAAREVLGDQDYKIPQEALDEIAIVLKRAIRGESRVLGDGV